MSFLEDTYIFRGHKTVPAVKRAHGPGKRRDKQILLPYNTSEVKIKIEAYSDETATIHLPFLTNLHSFGALDPD
jgi:hypothetical protein